MEIQSKKSRAMCVYWSVYVCVYPPQVEVSHHCVCACKSWCGCHTLTITCWETVPDGQIDMEM